MTISFPDEQGSLLARLVSLGRFRSVQEAVFEAVKRMEKQFEQEHLQPAPLTEEEAERVYAPDAAWDQVERSLAGRARPEV